MKLKITFIAVLSFSMMTSYAVCNKSKLSQKPNNTNEIHSFEQTRTVSQAQNINKHQQSLDEVFLEIEGKQNSHHDLDLSDIEFNHGCGGISKNTEMVFAEEDNLVVESENVNISTNIDDQGQSLSTKTSKSCCDHHISKEVLEEAEAKAFVNPSSETITEYEQIKHAYIANENHICDEHYHDLIKPLIDEKSCC